MVRDDSPVLTIGGFGNPKYLCDDCSALLDTVTLSRDYEKIEAAMDEIGRKMGDNHPDKLTFDTMGGIIANAAERAKAIQSGEYDFSLDEAPIQTEEEGFDELPEELCETEEDKEKDRQDEEKDKRFDKLYNIVLICACIGVGIFTVWKIIEALFL